MTRRYWLRSWHAAPVTGRINLHTAACYGQPLGVRCRSCERRALVPMDAIGATSGDMRELK